MTKKDFLEKYPEINEDGKISFTKISLLVNWLKSSLSANDDKIKNLVKDYNLVILSETRDKKIDAILEKTPSITLTK